MMQDRSTHVGCAVARYTKLDGFKTTLLACNYARTNLIEEKVYESGEPGSQCVMRDPVYTNLCVDPLTLTSTTQDSTTTTTTTQEPTTTTTTTQRPTTTTTTTQEPTKTTITSQEPTTTSNSEPPTSELKTCCDETKEFMKNFVSNMQKFNDFFKDISW